MPSRPFRLLRNSTSSQARTILVEHALYSIFTVTLAECVNVSKAPFGLRLNIPAVEAVVVVTVIVAACAFTPSSVTDGGETAHVDL
jgi:hypothetical protein